MGHSEHTGIWVERLLALPQAQPQYVPLRHLPSSLGEFNQALQGAVLQGCSEIQTRTEEGEAMVENIQAEDTNGQAMAKATVTPKSLRFAKDGIRTGEDFANTMSALMSDLIEGSITPEVGNAVCNAGGKLLKMVEMQYKYASPPQVVKERPNIALAELSPTSE